MLSNSMINKKYKLELYRTKQKKLYITKMEAWTINLLNPPLLFEVHVPCPKMSGPIIVLEGIDFSNRF